MITYPCFFMRALIKLYTLLNLVSLDVVCGAVISALFFARIFHVEILPYGLIALALTVWIIYTIDHLRDARRIAGKASTTRHRFHQEKFRPILFVTCLAITTDAIVILFMRPSVLAWGLVLFFIVAIYLLIQRYLKILKELFVASLYTWGVILPSVTVTRVNIDHHTVLLIIQFALVAFLNLLIYSWFDRKHDLADRQDSFATLLPERTVTFFIYSISLLGFGVAVYLLWDQFQIFPVILILTMNMLSLLIFSFERRFSESAYRIAGDAVFFLPGIYLMIM